MTAQKSPARAKPKRRGITLIEMLVLITATTTALGLCATTIQLLLRLKADAQSRYSATVSLDRLARQLRSDAHAASLARLETAQGGKTASLYLELGPKHAVVYEPRKSAVGRLETEDGRITHRESFALLHPGEVEFETRHEAGNLFVVVVIRKRDAKLGTHTPLSLEVVARVGKERPQPLKDSNRAKPPGGRGSVRAGRTGGSQRGSPSHSVKRLASLAQPGGSTR